MEVEGTDVYWPCRNLEAEYVLRKQLDSGGNNAPLFCIVGKILIHCEDISSWWKEQLPENSSIVNLRKQILSGTGLTTIK